MASQPLSIVLDVGNSSIGAALLFVHEPGEHTKRATVVSSRRMFLPLSDELDPATLERSLFAALRDLIDATAGDVQKVIVSGRASRVGNVFCIFSSPWVDVVPRVDTIERTVPFTLSERLVTQTVAAHVTEYTRQHPSVAVCDSRTTSILLNGYETTHPFGMSTHKVTLGSVLSVMPASLKKQLDVLITRRLHPKGVYFHAFSVIAFDALRDLFPAQNDWFFADITGEITDTIRVSHSVLTQAGSFPQGWHALVRAVAKKMHTTPDVARSLIAMTVRDASHDTTTEKIKKVVEPVLQSWIQQLTPTGSETQALIPRIPMFLTSDDDVAPLYEATLNILVPGSSVQVITKEQLTPFIALEPEARYDTFIALATLAVAKLRP